MARLHVAAAGIGDAGRTLIDAMINISQTG